MLKEIFKKILPLFFINWYHFLLALLGAIFYGFPSQKLTVVGVTGTNGKSTVVELTAKILMEASFKVASLSSIKFKIGNEEWPNTLKMTMPGRFQLQKFLKRALDSGCQYAVLEVTSEGIKQYRHKFIDFDIAVFTNLTPEHIEAHGSFKKYKEAKGKLFQATKKIHIVNLDDDNADYFLSFPATQKIGYKISKTSRPINGGPTSINETFIIEGGSPQLLPQGLRFLVDNTQFNLKLLGEFNIYNALTAICVGVSQGISLATCRSALEGIKGIPGRMELVISEPFKVFVDYAFTPAALEKVYQTLTADYPPEASPQASPLANLALDGNIALGGNKLPTTQLICVLGAAGGGRDKWKRPVLGKLASKYCDEIIITNEDPYDENPREIIEQVAQGASEGLRANPRQSVSIYKILDRHQAIHEALKKVRQGGVVVITGKGSEPWMCVTGGKKISWDDRKIVREEFKKMRQES